MGVLCAIEMHTKASCIHLDVRHITIEDHTKKQMGYFTYLGFSLPILAKEEKPRLELRQEQRDAEHALYEQSPNCNYLHISPSVFMNLLRKKLRPCKPLWAVIVLTLWHTVLAKILYSVFSIESTCSINQISSLNKGNSVNCRSVFALHQLYECRQYPTVILLCVR